MSTRKKGNTFTYNGGLDAVEVHCPVHTIIVANGGTVEVCDQDATVLSAHPDFTAGGASAPVDTTPQEVEA